ncbi:MAG: PspC domain-containing protein [Rhodothermales bacterium]
MKSRSQRQAGNQAKDQAETEQESSTLLRNEFASLDLESMSDEELERLLFEESSDGEKGFWNLPTIAGLSLIVVGVAYIFQELGMWNGFDVSMLAEMLPWLAGILIILLGFGVLSWRPKKKKRKIKKAVESPSGEETILVEEQSGENDKKKRLTRSRNKKISGVAAGIAEYFSIDPTLVRIAFVVGLVASGGPPLILAYIILAIVMPDPEERTQEARVTIIKD